MRSKHRIVPPALGPVSVAVASAGNRPRTNTLRTLGGWVAHPRAEDTVQFVGLAELTPGYFTPEVTWLYRQHGEQLTKSARWPDLSASIAVAEQPRIDAIRASFGSGHRWRSSTSRTILRNQAIGALGAHRQPVARSAAAHPRIVARSCGSPKCILVLLTSSMVLPAHRR